MVTFSSTIFMHQSFMLMDTTQISGCNRLCTDAWVKWTMIGRENGESCVHLAGLAILGRVHLSVFISLDCLSVECWIG